VDIQELPSNDLARLCADHPGPEEWREFVRRFTRPICLSALRVARLWGESSPHVIDDIVQDVLVKFCEDNRRVLREFEPRHPDSFIAFVKVVSAAAANDYFRKRNTSKRGGGLKEEPLSDFHVGAPQDSEWIERNLLLKEIDRFLEASGRDQIGRRDRMVFWLYYQQGMTASAIADLPGISLTVKGVESVLHRMTSLIRSHLRKPAAGAMSGNNLRPREGFPALAAIDKGEWI
jgi:RNA polymerase sigma-70 factor (ECF subfamily)